MKKLFIVLFSLGLLFLFSCGDQEMVTEGNDLAPGAAPKPESMRSTYQSVPIYDVIRIPTIAEEVFDQKNPLNLNINVFKVKQQNVESLNKDAMLIELFVYDSDNNIYAKYPVRVEKHPSIHIWDQPLTYLFGSNTKLYYTDSLGKMTMYARSKTGNRATISFDVGGIKYKVFLGDS